MDLIHSTTEDELICNVEKITQKCLHDTLDNSTHNPYIDLQDFSYCINKLIEDEVVSLVGRGPNIYIQHYPMDSWVYEILIVMYNPFSNNSVLSIKIKVE